jgi:hypothetical protein
MQQQNRPSGLMQQFLDDGSEDQGGAGSNPLQNTQPATKPIELPQGAGQSANSAEPGGVAGPDPGPADAGSNDGAKDAAPPQHYNTKLMEGDPSKMNPEHAATSPKYDFLNLANSGKYNYNQMPDMLKELQSGANGRLWQGWTADGKGNFVYTGDPKQLAPEWKGVTHVDAVGAYGNMAQGKDPSGWRWGADDGSGSASGAATDGSGMPSLMDYYNGANNGSGMTTAMDPEHLKSILQRYYGNIGGGMNLGAGSRLS